MKRKSKRPVPRTRRGNTKISVTIVGAGRLASCLAVALKEAGVTIVEIVARDSAAALRRASAIARIVGARSVTMRRPTLSADIVWLCVPDRAISEVALEMASKLKKDGDKTIRFAFHSSGALGSDILEPLRIAGADLASVHPLMTFVEGSKPGMKGVPFAIEGDAGAVVMAERVVRTIGGKSFNLSAARKAAYHAWATMTSPLFIAFLAELEEEARAAGMTRAEARERSLPILQQTLANYARLGAAASFSGPLVRGDAETIRKHLAALGKKGDGREVYLALARSALKKLPVRNRSRMRRILTGRESGGG